MTDTELCTRLKQLQWCAVLAIVGVALVSWIIVTNSTVTNGQVVITVAGSRLVLLAGGASAVLPFTIYLFVLTVWHWKVRYKGDHSAMWGVLMLVEWSGLSKLLYLFRHVVRDARGSGGYERNLSGRAA